VGLAERGAMTTSSVAPPSLVTTDSVDAAAEEAAGEGVAEGVAVGEAWGRTEEAGATDLLRRVAHAPVIVIADADQIDIAVAVDLPAGQEEHVDAALAGAEARAGADAVLVSDGPVPGDCDLTALRRLGERAAEMKTPGGAR